MLARTDLALWRLPRPLRKVAVTPIAFLCGIGEAWADGAREFRPAWRRIMAAVELRPSEWPADPSEGRGTGTTICGRLLVGRGSDTWDPLCALPKGHGGRCLAEEEARDV